MCLLAHAWRNVGKKAMTPYMSCLLFLHHLCGLKHSLRGRVFQNKSILYKPCVKTKGSRTSIGKAGLAIAKNYKFPWNKEVARKPWRINCLVSIALNCLYIFEVIAISILFWIWRYSYFKRTPCGHNTGIHFMTQYAKFKEMSASSSFQGFSEGPFNFNQHLGLNVDQYPAMT